MDRNSNIGIIVTVVGIGILVLFGYLLFASSASDTSDTGGTPTTTPSDTGGSSGPFATTSTTTSTTSTSSVGTSSSRTITVRYTPTGFSPAQVTIKQGDIVSFVRDSGGKDLWVASAPHPAHNGYDGTSLATHCADQYAGPKPFDQCVSGATFTFTFDKKGTWKYHNHDYSADTGTVIVQ